MQQYTPTEKILRFLRRYNRYIKVTVIAIIALVINTPFALVVAAAFFICSTISANAIERTSLGISNRTQITVEATDENILNSIKNNAYDRNQDVLFIF